MRKLLRVNLSKGVAKDEGIPKNLAIDYVGGRGFGSKYLYDEVRRLLDRPNRCHRAREVEDASSYELQGPGWYRRSMHESFYS